MHLVVHVSPQCCLQEDKSKFEPSFMGSRMSNIVYGILFSFSYHFAQYILFQSNYLTLFGYYNSHETTEKSIQILKERTQCFRMGHNYQCNQTCCHEFLFFIYLPCVSHSWLCFPYKFPVVVDDVLNCMRIPIVRTPTSSQ